MNLFRSTVHIVFGLLSNKSSKTELYPILVRLSLSSMINLTGGLSPHLHVNDDALLGLPLV
jgi:hypothetical protein